ncbi:MAG: hypothetical protein M9955_02750 [Rhizobiaceae bacterium]|nr:hypothetical protein [Rhizobiaceae bacterium]
MGIRCRVSPDMTSEAFDMDFAVVPRIGEHVTVPNGDGVEEFRVTRVVHAAASDVDASITVEVTDKLL